MLRQLFCNHDYSKTAHFVTQSEAEMLKEMGLQPNTHSNFQKKYITDYKCMKCRKLKRKAVVNHY